MDSVIVDEINNLNDDEGTNFMPKMKERAYNIAVSVSTTNVGQLLFKQLDNIFWITEKTAKWSCTPDLYDKNKTQCKPATLVRPLPWLLFLPALLLIRCARSTLSCLSQLVGCEAIRASDVVEYMQMCRRKLRALKYQGLRLVRIRTEENWRQSNGKGIRSCDGGIIQAISASFARALSCQPPDVFEQMCELLTHEKKYTKCSLNESTNSNKYSGSKKRGHRKIDDTDSDISDDGQRLRALLEKSFNDETDSDDEDFVVGSRDEETFNQPFNDETDSEEESMVADRQPEDGDDDTYLSDDRTSGLGEENELHNDSKATISPEKNQENAEAKTDRVAAEEQNPSKTFNDLASANNGVIDEVPEEVVKDTNPTADEKSVDSNSSHTTDSQSPSTADNSRDSSKENLGVPMSSGSRIRSHRPSSHNNRPKSNRTQKKINGDNHRQQVQGDSTNKAAHSTNSNKLNHGNNHRPKTTKRSQF